MKKILTFLAGIVFLTTILTAGGYKSATSQDDPNGQREDLKKVIIYVKIFEEDGEKHLQLYESDKPSSVEIDSLHVAYVDPGTRVVWRRAKDSGIKKFKRIGPVTPGVILPEDATTILLHKRYRARVPKNEIDSGTTQKYIIVYVTQEDNEERTRDPYLRIR